MCRGMEREVIGFWEVGGVVVVYVLVWWFLNLLGGY